MMTNTTMALLEQVLRFHTDNDDYIGAVADALEQLRVSGKPADEIALRQAMEKYLKKVEA